MDPQFEVRTQPTRAKDDHLIPPTCPVTLDPQQNKGLGNKSQEQHVKPYPGDSNYSEAA